MEKVITPGHNPSREIWEHLEELVRAKVREFIQAILEDEVTELIGRRKSERRTVLDDVAVYRNGYGKERRFTLSCGTIAIRRPRVRGLKERFESRIIPLFARRTEEVSKLIPQLYLHGLAEGDFDLALRGLLGQDAPISAGTVSRLKEVWHIEWEEWRRRSLSGLELVYLWVDGVYVKAGLEKAKAALLVAVGGLSDGRKVIIAVEPGYRESVESWSGLLRDLKDRGMNYPHVVIGDGNLGIWGALRNVYPDSLEQRCWNHKLRNVLDKLPKRVHGKAKGSLQGIAYSETRGESELRRDNFVRWCRKEGFTRAAETLEDDWERMVTFYQFPKEHWKHLRTTNPVESPFAALRLRTNAAKRFKKVSNATVVIWKMLLIGEQRFKHLDAPDKLKEIYLGLDLKINLKTKQEEVTATI